MKENLLIQLGMTQYEAKLYLVLLYHPRISAYDLAEKSGLYRQVTYDSLKRLQEKGFVSSIQEGRTKRYEVLDPKLLVDLFQEKVDHLSSELPLLSKIYSQTQEDISVQTFTGANLLRLAFKDILLHLKDGEELLATVNDENLVVQTDDDRRALAYYENQLTKRKIKERVLLSEGSTPLLTKGTSKYKFIPKQFTQDIIFQVYGDTVQLLLFHRQPAHLIIIKDKVTAQSYRNQFEFMWKHAKK